MEIKLTVKTVFGPDNQTYLTLVNEETKEAVALPSSGKTGVLVPKEQVKQWTAKKCS